MRRIVVLVVLVSGLCAGVGLAEPSLVFLGGLACLFPGVALLLAPTVCLWSIGFSTVFLPLHPRLGSRTSATLAGAAVLLGMGAATLPGNLQALRLARTHALPDLEPSVPVPLWGDVRLDLLGGGPWDQEVSRRREGLRGYRCDALCAATLLTPGVTSVTVNDARDDGALSRHARTYAVVDRLEAGDLPIVEADLSHRSAVFGAHLPDQSRRTEGVLSALSGERCLVLVPTPSSHDLRIREVWSNRDADREVRWSLAASAYEARALVVEDAAGSVLARRRRAAISAPLPPLFVGWNMMTWDDAHFRWARWRYGASTHTDEVEAAVGLRTLVALTVPEAPTDPGARIAGLRDALRSGLEDPSRERGDASFSTVVPYVDALAPKRAAPDDVALLRRAFADPRVLRLPTPRAVALAIGDDLSPLREPIIDRLGRSGPGDRDALGPMNRTLDAMPAGAFATLTEQELALLDDEERRTRAEGLVARLADQGADATPRLLSLLDAHLPPLRAAKPGTEAHRAHRAVIDGVQVALCRMGHDADGAGPTLERLSNEGAVPPTVGERLGWRVMRVRLGAPIDAVVPEREGADVASERARVRREVERIAAGERPCGWS